MLLVSHSKFSAHLIHASYMYIDKGRLSHNPVRRTAQNLRFYADLMPDDVESLLIRLILFNGNIDDS